MDKVGQEGIDALQKCVDLLGGKKPMPNFKEVDIEKFKSMFGGSMGNFMDFMTGNNKSG